MKPRMIFALAAFAVLVSSLLLWSAPPAHAGEAQDNAALGWGMLSAALAAGLSALAAGIAVAKVGAAAVGALAEKPELFGRLLIFIGVAEGIAIYGLIVSVLILNRL